MAQNEYSEHRLIFKSTPKALNFNNQTLRSFPTILMSSDIFGFYPYGELFFADSAGIIVDNLLFVEGLEFEFKIGNDEDGYVGHTFYWSEDQINNTKLADNISGDNIFILKSAYDLVDETRSKAWSEKTLSEVVSEIVTNDFKITDSNKKNIVSTTGKDEWYQINTKIRDFLWSHRQQAYTVNYPNSPFVSFINTNGEFYFSCLESLFNEQQPVASYKFSFSEKSSLDSDTIKDYDIKFIGNPKNEFNYTKRIYTIDKTGIYSYADNNIQDFLVKGGSGKTIYRQQLQENISSYEYLGINELPVDEYRINAKRNFKYIDSALPVRMNLMIDFNPKCVSGKLIDLKVGSVMENKQIFTEFSDNWLIISDSHFMDYDGKPVTSLIVAKSKINIDRNHPFYGDFLS